MDSSTKFAVVVFPIVFLVVGVLLADVWFPLKRGEDYTLTGCLSNVQYSNYSTTLTFEDGRVYLARQDRITGLTLGHNYTFYFYKDLIFGIETLDYFTDWDAGGGQ